MLTACGLVYKVMKKVGKLTEASMVKPPEPKFHPLVSDDLFENRVKGYPSKGIKGDLDEDELPMNQTPEASKMTTNSPRRATPKSVQVGGPYDLTAEATDDWIGDAEDDIERRGTKGKCTPITKKGCTGKAKTLAKTFKKMAKKTKNESTTPKPVRQVRARAEAGKPLKKGTAKMVANDAGSEMGSRMKAAEKL